MNEIHEALIVAGIDRNRLDGVLASHDAWGSLVHAFEVLTVLGIVLETWKRAEEA